ncbi:MAG: aminotransferase class I/II-fold pyridoxal phosphate-dependent enzyme [Anaerolineae bacterium]|nr:aminotransferase class I/II-fold pyridoxal phosphate-dependent enzyme [Anaerolineae bacterium]
MKIETFELERWMTRHELNVKYDIAESGVFPLSLNNLLAFEDPQQREALLERLINLRLGYNEAVGTFELRSLLASTYENCTADNILVTTGAIEANFLVMNTLLNPGDHVVAVYPAYQQLFSVPRAIGCDVSRWKVEAEKGFKYDVEALKKLVTPKTRLIVMNTPHNPSGAMLSAEEMQYVYDLAESVDAKILCDEAYRWITVPGGDSFAPPAFNLGPRAISTGTFSKPFGLPGIRTGWVAAPKEIVQQCWFMRDYISLSPGKLNDALAVLALKHREAIMRRNAEIIRVNLDMANQWINSRSDLLSWKAPRGGLLAMMHYNLDIASLELADRLAIDYSVMLAPGSAFGYEQYLRIGIGQNPQIFKAGIEAAGRCFDELRK